MRPNDQATCIHFDALAHVVIQADVNLLNESGPFGRIFAVVFEIQERHGALRTRVIVKAMRARHEAAEQSYMGEGVQILELARNAQKLFERQQPREKRRLLNFVLSNCTWEDGDVVANFRQPFDLLAETTAIATRAKAENRPNSAKNEIWLGD